MPYIICEKCLGYYELQEGEFPKDFDSCQCGGKLKYIESIENINEQQDQVGNANVCPKCGKEILDASKLCEKCEILKSSENPKKPWLAGLLSLFLPGLGYFYAGSIYKGFIGIGLFILWLFRELHYHPPYPWQAFVPGAIEIVVYFLLAFDSYWTAKKANKVNGGLNRSNGNLNRTCPNCSAENRKNSEYCVECGKDLKKTLFYVDGKISIIDASDIEITENSLIEYKKNFFGKRSGQISEYYLDKMGDMLINDRMQRLCSPFPFPYISLEFNYGKRRKSVYIPENNINDLIKTLEILNISYEDYYHFKN